MTPHARVRALVLVRLAWRVVRYAANRETGLLMQSGTDN
jgi:hypothetical protein